MAYKAICFDVDGTLYPSRIMNRRLSVRWFWHPFLGMKFRKERAAFRQHQHTYVQEIPLRWREAMILCLGTGEEPKEPFGEEPYRKMYDRMASCLYEPMRRMYRKTRPFDKVRDTFTNIHDKGLKVGVFSDFPLYEKLEGLGVADLVDFASSSDDCGFLKPDPRCVGYLLANLGLEPEDVLYVGDSYEKDVVGAYRAGVDGVLVNVGNDYDGDASRYPLAKAVFRSWNDFDSWLSAILEDN